MLTSFFLFNAGDFGVFATVQSEDQRWASFAPKSPVSHEIITELSKICLDTGSRPLTNLRYRHRAIMRCLRRLGVFPEAPDVGLRAGDVIPGECVFGITPEWFGEFQYRHFSHDEALFAEIQSELPSVMKYAPRPSRRITIS